MVMILKLLLMGSVFLVVFALALRTRESDALYMFNHSGDALRAFVAMYVVVPAVAVALALAFSLAPAVKIALVAIAFSPMPPILPGKQMKAGASLHYVAGLLFGSAIMSIVAAVGQAHGGRVEVESRPGDTTFSVVLPAAEAAPTG